MRMIHICLCILSQKILNLSSELKGFIWVGRDQAYGRPIIGYCICNLVFVGDFVEFNRYYWLLYLQFGIRRRFC